MPPPGCWAWTRTPSRRCWPRSRRRCGRSPRRPRKTRADRSPTCPLHQHSCSTSRPSTTRPGRCVSLHREHAIEGNGAGGTGTYIRRPGPLRVGIGGPVGSGKTALVAALCRSLRDELSLAVVTNDIYTREDAEILLRQGVLEPERITAVETGCCPHTAI